jgi:oligoribonuclease NrnB/cAMP/cGMP phosphodiesterase (DHH superfamily)
MKTTIIHHSADFDGIFCREIARQFLPDAELIGWDWADKKIPFPSEGTVYVLDLSPDCFESLDGILLSEISSRLIWIDHHKSAIEKWPPALQGYRIDGVAACRLAWQWFINIEAKKDEDDATKWPKLPTAVQFKNREVSEPVAVRLAGEYDIWDKRDPDAGTFQFGLRSTELTPEKWNWMLIGDAGPDQAVPKRYNTVVLSLLQDGRLLQKYQQRNDAMAMKQSFIVEWEGLKFLALNTQAKNSQAFASKDVPETGHDALLKFSFNGEVWDCSMYHAKHNTVIDLSQLAVMYGGGGHRGACGFRTTKLPFIN